MAVNTMEALVQGEESTEFVKFTRVGSKAFIAQRCSNRYGRYLAMTEYGVAAEKVLL